MVDRYVVSEASAKDLFERVEKIKKKEMNPVVKLLLGTVLKMQESGFMHFVLIGVKTGRKMDIRKEAVFTVCSTLEFTRDEEHLPDILFSCAKAATATLEERKGR